MRQTVIASHLPVKEIKERMLSAESCQQFKRWQALYIAATYGFKAEEIGDLVGVSTGTVHQWVYRYNHKGADALVLEGRGGRRHGLMTWDKEEELLQELLNKAKDGGIVVAQTIRRHAAKKLGREVSQDFAYDLLHRHGWRKIMPRPRHPKGDLKSQEEYKKNFLISWQPPQKPLAVKTNGR